MTHTMTEVMREYLPTLQVWARRLCRNAAHADDLVQNTLLKAFRSWHLYDPARGSYTAWLTVMMRRSYIDMWRRESTHSQTVEAVSLHPIEWSEIDDKAVDRIQIDAKLHRHLQDLPPTQREVLQLHFFEDLSDSEISRKLDAPLGTIKSRKRFGLIALRKMFGMK